MKWETCSGLIKTVPSKRVAQLALTNDGERALRVLQILK